ncbi:MAG: hypothetical protein JO058_08385, partial [Alphaproteobacteria bacterium]|nr:hypothetical protein [Alphaproteobacteria bacterium]
MTEDTRDADLQTHVTEFLRALNHRPNEVMRDHIAEVEKPDPQDLEDFRRYVGDLRRVYGQGLEDMYERIASHGRAICELSDEAELIERVQKMMTLVAADANDVPEVLASLEDAANELNPRTVVGLLLTVSGAGARGLPRQGQLDELVVDLTTYCLT